MRNKQWFLSQAILLLLKNAFKDLKLNKVWLMTFSTNIKARRLYTKVGFKKEGVLKEDYLLRGEFHDIVRMAVLKKDFQK